MFSSTFGSTSGPVRPQASWLSSLSTSTSTSSDTSPNTQRKVPLRGMTLPVTTTSKDSGANDTDSISGPQPIVAVASRLGMLGWFGSSSSIDNSVGERPVGEESKKTRVEEIVVEPRSEPVCPTVPDKEEVTDKAEVPDQEEAPDQEEIEGKEVPDREEVLLERERQVETREKELEERKLVMDQRERELDDRHRELVDAEKKGEEAIQRKNEEVEKRERELEERRGEFEEERKRWIEERNVRDQNPATATTPEVESTHTASECRKAMEVLKREMSLELLAERKKAEERELALETRVMKRVTEILALDRDSQQNSSWKKRWDISIKPLTRKSTSSTASDFGI